MRNGALALSLIIGFAATVFAQSGENPCTEDEIREEVQGLLTAIGDVLGDSPTEIEFNRTEDGLLTTEIDQGRGEIALVRIGRRALTIRMASCSIVRYSDADCQIAQSPTFRKEAGKQVRISDEEILNERVSIGEPDARSTAEVVASFFHTPEEFAEMQLSRSGLQGLGSSKIEYNYNWMRNFQERGATIASGYTSVRIDPKSGCISSVWRVEPHLPIEEGIIEVDTAKEIAWGYLKTKLFPASQRTCYSTTRHIGLGHRVMPDGNTRWFWNVTFECDPTEFGSNFGATVHVDAITGELLDVNSREIKILE